LQLKSKVVVHGLMASLLLTLVYFVIVSYLESFSHAIATFQSISYLMVPLIAGFGVQVAFSSYIREYSRTMHQSSANVTACGGLSASSMIDCCVHHVSDVIPLLGITAITSALVAFQPLFITIGLLSNVVGILTLLATIQQYRLYDSNGALVGIMNFNVKRMRNYAIVFSLMIAISFAWTLFNNQTNIIKSEGTFNLSPKTLEQRGLTVKVTPLSLNVSREVKFMISFDTHVGDLNFNVAQLASLEDDHGKTYASEGWSGASPGGHHREGTLTFPPLSGRPHSIKLVMKEIYGVDWIFEWNLTE